jgi:N-acetylglucosaminyldiphosphoundecaprenol N-acetyl-beta-D-mannosaminyltransferase
MSRRGDTGTRRRGDADVASASPAATQDESGTRSVPTSPRPRVAASPRRTLIAGVYVDNLSEDETLSRIDELIAGGGSHYMTVVNAAKVVAARRDSELRDRLAKAALVTADGMSVVWASRLVGQPLKQRVTGIDLFERLVAHAAGRGLSVYFLGARDESVGGVAKHFTTRFPDLRVAGYRNGYFDESQSPEIAREIMRSRADLLFVALGSPRQEEWIERHLIATGARFALGVGGSFDHLSGLQRRAPAWMQRAGLEWLHRFAREPRRLWRRYLIGNSIFIWLVARQMFSRNR